MGSNGILVTHNFSDKKFVRPPLAVFAFRLLPKTQTWLRGSELGQTKAVLFVALALTRMPGLWTLVPYHLATPHSEQYYNRGCCSAQDFARLVGILRFNISRTLRLL